MTKPINQELIANVLAVHLEVQRHVEDARHAFTALEIQVLADATATLNRFLLAWQVNEASKRKVESNPSRPRLTSHL